MVRLLSILSLLEMVKCRNYTRINIYTDHACNKHIPKEYQNTVHLHFVQGHKKSSYKDNIDKEFSKLDKALRYYIKYRE